MYRFASRTSSHALSIAMDSSYFSIASVHRASTSGNIRETPSSASYSRFRDYTVEITPDHRQGPAEQVAEIVCEIAVIAFDEALIREVAVLAMDHITQQEIPQRVGTVRIDDVEGLHDIAKALRHLLAAMVNEAMAEYGLRQRQPGAHEHGGPDDTVEAGDVLADDMKVGGPVRRRTAIRIIPAEAKRRYIVDQRVEPHIDHMPRIVGQRDAPVESGAGHADIVETALDQADNLVAPATRAG